MLRLGSKVLVITPSSGPSDAAVRIAALLARPDGGHSEVLITRAVGEKALESAQLKAVAKRIHRLGFEGHLRSELETVPHAVDRATSSDDHSFVVVDDATFAAHPVGVPLLVLDGAGAFRLIGENGASAEVERRLAKGGVALSRPASSPQPPTAPDPGAASSGTR
jgi:hypothetical protein